MARDRELEKCGAKEGARNRARRSQWNLEKQRRAGSSQMWELLSYAGELSEEIVRNVFELLAETGAAQEPSWRTKRAAKRAKAEWRYAKMLDKILQKDQSAWWSFSTYKRRLWQQLKDNTLKRKVNDYVEELGSGRFRGDDADDYLDIGTNKERSVVATILDGPAKKVCTERFKR